MTDIPRGGFVLMPPRPGVCPVCAVKHDPAQPHNRDSLYYQYRFWAEHRRWPTWVDAMSHCDVKTRRLWTDALRERGVPEKLLAEAEGEDGRREVDQRE
ncbi:MAG: hypothetical protein IJ124_04480 [Clostridia bacterium]|nr:hypothetical protein [Clostridia bacterium]